MFMPNAVQSHLDQHPNPWYKEPWPWLLMLGPAIVVVACISMWFQAQRYNSEMVVDDYYKEGKEIGLQLARDDKALEMGIQAQVIFSLDGRLARVITTSQQALDPALTLRLLHPVSAKNDIVVALKQTASNTYEGAINQPLTAYHWYVRLEDNANVWRVQKTWNPAKEGQQIALLPKFSGH
jgi:hypothetical protein